MSASITLHRFRSLLCTVLCLSACAPASPPGSAPERLHEVLDGYWSYLFENDNYLREKYGAPIERLPDVSLAKAREHSDVARRFLTRLAEVRPEELGHQDWVAHQVLLWDLRLEAERSRHYWLAVPITPYVARNSLVPQIYRDFAFESDADVDEYLRLLGLLAPYFASVLEKVRGQAERGIVVPEAAMEVVMPIWRALRGPGEQSPFYVARERLAKLDADAAAAFEREVIRILDSEIEPALERLLDFLAGDYSRQAPETIGYDQYPGGAEYYRFIARYFTTLDLEPEEIHRLGLERAAEITAEMDEVRRGTGFAGTREQFHRFLKTDPQFLATAPEEVEALLRSHLEKIEPHLDAYFSRLPAAPYDVRRLPPAFEAGLTYGYYRPPTQAEPTGYYFFNGSRLDQRPLYLAASLIYHELMPGHHLQVNLQAENEDLPIYLQNHFYSAHAEGWAAYASELAREMGLYEDPYLLYGRLSAELRYAARLVVDTGLNALGWSHEQAVAYMQEHTVESKAQIFSETLRYGVSLPGQALAYKIGHDKFWQLRRRAEEALGERFDIRRFHDAILDYGPMPLTVLEDHVDWFIEQEATR